MSRHSNDSVSSSSEEDEELGQSIEYGYRRAGRNVNFRHRDSSALTPAQAMERDVHYVATEEAMERAGMILQVMTLLFVVYQQTGVMIQNLLRLSQPAFEMIDTISEMRVIIKQTLQHLHLLFQWVASYGELAFLYAEDLNVYIRRSRRFDGESHRKIAEISRATAQDWFGLTPFALRNLFVHWRVPESFTGPDGHIFSGEECFLIFMYHLCQGVPYTRMAAFPFGGDPRRFSHMFDLMVDHLYNKFYNKISGTSLSQWIPRYVHRCRQLIHSALGDGGIFQQEIWDGEVVEESWILHHFDFNTFRIFGFLDDFALRTGRPAGEYSRLRAAIPDIQRAFYSGYFQAHGLKAQVV